MDLAHTCLYTWLRNHSTGTLSTGTSHDWATLLLPHLQDTSVKVTGIFQLVSSFIFAAF